jgi:drug/metabolite transporter (DMT)-like permease
LGWPLGILFGFASALASSVGFLMRHRGAVAAPDVDARHPLRTVLCLFRERWWTLGYVVALVAWLLHVVALKLAPLSLVQAALASSFVFLGAAAERLFGLKVDRRQWAGIALATAGLALLGVTSAQAKPEGSEASYALTVAVVVQAGLLGIGLVLIAAPRARRCEGDRRAVLLATAAGLLFTVTHIGVKALSGDMNPIWVPVVLGGFVLAFFASARSLQLGNAVAVIAVTGAASNASAIFAGIVVFGDPIGDSGPIIALRLFAFLLVIAAAALLPAPVRAARQSRQRSRGEAATAVARV